MWLEAGAVFGITLVLNRQRLRQWLGAAEACGLIVEEISSVLAARPQLRARDGPLEVRIEGVKRSESGSTRVAVVVPGPPGFSGVRIRREERKLAGMREVEIGDDGFDSTFFVEGPLRLLCALLNAEMRCRLRQVNTEVRLEITGGELRADMFDRQVSKALILLLQIGSSLAKPLDALQCLAENALQDPMPGARLRNLRVLARELPGDPKTVEVLRSACSDASPEVRLRAALELGAEGRAVLLDLVESMEEGSWSATAISVLGRELPFERMRAILIRALSRRSIDTAHACLEVLGRNGTAAAVETLAKVLAREKGELATAAAVALEATGSAAAEPALIQALSRDPPELRVAAADALGRVGSAAAVLPLKEAAERFSNDGALGRATRQAIAEIQSRLQGASPGQLSLAGAEAGRLSLAQAEAGQLSLASDPTGELSLASAEPGQLSLSEGEEGLKPAPGSAT